MDMENVIPEEKEPSILTLTDENGQDVDFEYPDCIDYEGAEYLVLTPARFRSYEVRVYLWNKYPLFQTQKTAQPPA